MEREDDREKYGSFLMYHEEDPARDADAVRAFENGTAPERPPRQVCVSVEGELVAASEEAATRTFTRLLAREVGELGPDLGTLVELGCGYGYHLWTLSKAYPRLRYLGGDYSANAVRLAGRLYRDHPGITVRQFNFYDEAYALIGEVGPGPATVVTIHAIEQLPTARPFVDALVRTRSKIRDVLHFEPLYDSEDPTSLLGALRRRYAEVNDYNRDLLAELRRRPEIEIVEMRHDVLGLNPLNPTSVVRWRFRE